MSAKEKATIDNMSQEEMARLHRFAPLGSPLFAGELGEYFAASFKKKGGMTPEISKRIGWEGGNHAR